MLLNRFGTPFRQNATPFSMQRGQLSWMHACWGDTNFAVATSVHVTGMAPDYTMPVTVWWAVSFPGDPEPLSQVGSNPDHQVVNFQGVLGPHDAKFTSPSIAGSDGVTLALVGSRLPLPDLSEFGTVNFTFQFAGVAPDGSLTVSDVFQVPIHPKTTAALSTGSGAENGTLQPQSSKPKQLSDKLNDWLLSRELCSTEALRTARKQRQNLMRNRTK